MPVKNGALFVEHPSRLAILGTKDLLPVVKLIQKEPALIQIVEPLVKLRAGVNQFKTSWSFKKILLKLIYTFIS